MPTSITAFEIKGSTPCNAVTINMITKIKANECEYGVKYFRMLRKLFRFLFFFGLGFLKVDCGFNG